MNLVLQKHSKGCGIAALSMITGQEYDTIRYRLFGLKGEVRGLFLTSELVEEIKNEGYDLKHEYLHGYEGDDYLTPIAGANILFEVVVYKDSPCAHFVCMDETGKLYDPMFGHTTWDFYDKKPYSRIVVYEKKIA